MNACAKIAGMFLVVTRNCNLQCRYCVVECNEKKSVRKKGHMSVETGLAAVAYFERLLQASQPRQTRVTYYGGEPTMNRDVLLATLPRIAAIDYPGQVYPVGAAVITNAYRYHDDVARALKQHGGGVCVSLDGEAEHHDLARVTPDGKATHAAVVENIRRYQDMGLDVDLSCTVGRHNIDSLPEIVRYFVQDIGISDIEIQIPYLVQTGNPDFISSDALADQLLKAYDVLLDLGSQEFTCYRRVQNFLNGSFRYRDCGAAGGQITVDPDGRFGPCHSMVGNKEFFTGSVHDSHFDVCESPLFAEWSRRIPINMPQCRDCPYIGICGGGCLFNAWGDSKDIWQKDPQVCLYMEKLLPWVIRRLWRETRRKGLMAQTAPAAGGFVAA